MIPNDPAPNDSAPNDAALLLNVEDLTRSQAFYAELGFELIRSWPEGEARWCSMRCGSITIMLNETKRSRSSERRARGDYSDAVLYLYMDDAASFAAGRELPDCKVRHVGPQDYGLDEVWIRDPDGYHVVLATDLNPDGA